MGMESLTSCSCTVKTVTDCRLGKVIDSPAKPCPKKGQSSSLKKGCPSGQPKTMKKSFNQ
jgi:hypothetical protein